MPVSIRCALLLAASLLGAAPVAAWAPETRVKMADEATRLMPATLRMALTKHRKAVLRGVLEPMVDEDSPEHRAPWSGGSLDRSVQREARELIAALGKRTPFRELAERFGRLAHYVMDAGFPPGVSDGDGEARFRHFAAFCEERRTKFPLVFYGHEDPALERGDFRAFALEAMERARAEDRELARAYAAAADGDPGAFDDRSVPFAVGSLAYSRSITDVVRAWLSAWSTAGGDRGRTPYTKKPETR